ncbi:MAG: hypothetical protein ABIO76_04775, partial [Ginsengibacter sp.]
FNWYDVKREEQTNLRIHPFCYMDSNMIFHEKRSPQEGLSELLFFYNECKSVNGTFICIFHNHLMGPGNIEWAKVYEQFLGQID